MRSSVIHALRAAIEVLQRPVSAKMMLIDYDEYAKLVAAAYERAPSYDPKAEKSFASLAQHIETMFQRVNRKTPMVTGPGQPYSSAEDLMERVKKEKKIDVSTDFSEHPFFTQLLNLKFRAVHDIMQHIQKKKDFSLKGEVASFNAALRTLPPEAVPAAFTELVGQACYYIVNGHFPEQKIAILPGFDFYNVGAVEGYDVENKKLKKRDG